jgi:hypothetical protein
MKHALNKNGYISLFYLKPILGALETKLQKRAYQLRNVSVSICQHVTQLEDLGTDFH